MKKSFRVIFWLLIGLGALPYVVMVGIAVAEGLGVPLWLMMSTGP
jgi:hypothetical protein